MAKKYLITGGSGFIGSALVKRLVKEGYRARVLDNNLRGSKEKLIEVFDKIEFIEGDIRDKNLVSKSLKGVDGVIHLAYLNGTEFFYKMPELVLDIAVKGMANVIDGCIENNVKELILASSSEVYQMPQKIPTDETVPLIVPDPLNPRYSYGGGKIISELMAINYGRKHFDRAVIFRPHNVYGPDMGWEHVIPQFAMRMKEMSESKGAIDFQIQGTGKETRAFIFIDDFTDGLMKIIEKGKHLEIYHIGTMDEISIENVAREVAAYFGRKIKIVPGKLSEGSTRRRCPDISKLKKLGFRPRTNFKVGLAKTAEWYEQNYSRNPELAKKGALYG